MGRTNIVLDEELVAKGFKLTGIKTKRELIDYALHELVRRESQKRIRDLKGKIDWEGDLHAWRKGRIKY